MLQGKKKKKTRSCLYWVKSPNSAVTDLSATRDLFNNKHVFLHWLYLLYLCAPMKLHLLPSLKGPCVLPLQPPPPCCIYSSPAVTVATKAAPQQACDPHPGEHHGSGPPSDTTHAVSSLPLHFNFFFPIFPLPPFPRLSPFTFIAKHQTFLQ